MDKTAAPPDTGTLDTGTLDVAAIRQHFAFPATGRIVTNNAASTQPPRELLALLGRTRPRGTRTCTAVSRRPPSG